MATDYNLMTIRPVATIYNKKHRQSLSIVRYRQIIKTAKKHFRKIILDNPRTKELIPEIP